MGHIYNLRIFAWSSNKLLASKFRSNHTNVERYLHYFSGLDILLNGEIKSDDVCGETTSVSVSLATALSLVKLYSMIPAIASIVHYKTIRYNLICIVNLRKRSCTFFVIRISITLPPPPPPNKKPTI